MGACGDAPVLIVNDRRMCSWMNDAKLDELVDRALAGGGPRRRPSRASERRRERAFRIPELRSGRDPDGRAQRQQLAPQGLRGARRLRRAAQDPRREDSARAGHRRAQEVGAARPRRRGLPDRPQVELHAQELRRRQVRRVQLRRGRARHVQGPRHPALQPARGVRGHGHRRVRDGRQPRLQLHPRRDLGSLPALRGGDRGGVRRGLARRQHPRAADFSFHLLQPPRLRRLHLRRGNGAPRVARGQEGAAAVQAAVSRVLRRVRQADDDQQHGDVRRRAVDHQQRRRGVPEPRPAEQRRHQALLGVGRRRAPRQLRGEARHAVRHAARDGGRHARRAQAQGVHSGRLVDARAARRRDDGRPTWTTTRSPRRGRCSGSGAVIIMDETRCMVRIAAAPVVLLLRGVVRPVHAVPRRHGLAVADGRPHRARARAATRTSTC